MSLNTKAVEEFQEIFSQDYGEKISSKEAREMGESLLSLFDTLTRPVPDNEKLFINGKCRICGKPQHSNDFDKMQKSTLQ